MEPGCEPDFGTQQGRAMTLDESTTRERVLGLVVSAGPITAADLAAELGLTSAGVRRHLGHLSDDGLIAEHERPGNRDRGRGRPARSYVATPEGQRALSSAYATVAVEALDYLRERGDLDSFVESRVDELEQRLAARVDSDAPLVERVDQLAIALADEGYAASVRPGIGGAQIAAQLCQGHCPVQQVAEHASEWCEAETQAISRVLGVHVQRLSTLAGGAHVCTTNIPLTVAGRQGGQA